MTKIDFQNLEKKSEKNLRKSQWQFENFEISIFSIFKIFNKKSIDFPVPFWKYFSRPIPIQKCPKIPKIVLRTACDPFKNTNSAHEKQFLFLLYFPSDPVLGGWGSWTFCTDTLLIQHDIVWENLRKIHNFKIFPYSNNGKV